MNLVSPSLVNSSHELKLKAQVTGGSSLFSVTANIKIESDYFLVNFTVKRPSAYRWRFDTNYHHEYYKNWMLWERDVVEFFLQGRSEIDQVSAPYIEFLVNPEGREFALKTLTPRLLIMTPLDLDFTSVSRVLDDQWEVSMKIKNPFQDSTYFYGNLHACLGDGNQREYFSFSHLDHPRIDFHRPNQFISFGSV